MDVIRDRQDQGIRFYTIKWNWPKRLQQTASVCIEEPRFGPLTDSQLTWNRAKSIIMPVLRGERKPRTESEKIVESHTAKLQTYLKFEPKSSSRKSEARSSHADRTVASGVSRFEIIRCQSLDSGAEHARSLRTRDILSHFKNTDDVGDIST